MPPISISDIADLAQLAVLVGGGIFFLARLGGKLDRLSDVISQLDRHLRDHENRLRLLEGRPPAPTNGDQPTSMQRSM